MSVYRVGSNKSSVNNFPSVRPTLDLDFANSKTLDPRITFTRSSGGSYVGADGLIKLAGVNEARFDHDPYTGESLGLLVEEARTNLLLQSEDFSTTWLNTNSTETANAAVAPNGATTADKIIPDSGADNGQFRQDISKNASSITYTLSCYGKQAEYNSLIISAEHTNNTVNKADVGFSLVDGAVISTAAAFGTFTSASSSVQTLPNGWFRFSLTYTSGTETSQRIRIYGYDSVSATGDGTSGIFIWGAQLEAGSFPTSYIPTQASTRTRAADNASITGKNFSEWYRQDEGTIFLSYYIIGSNSDNTVMAINNTTQNEQIDSRWFASGTGYRVRVGGVNQASYAMGDIPPLVNINYKTSFGYQKNNFSMSLNNTTINDSTGDIPNLVQMEIGKRVNSSRGNIQLSRLSYYPKRLPNQQLQVLTR
jgi:hypothetical protein